MIMNQMEEIRIAANLAVRKENKIVFCTKCQHEFCQIALNWKEYATMRVATNYVSLLRIHLHADLEIREYFCPSCKTLLDVELAKKAEPPSHDIQLKI